jgi:hypothetical protein
MTRPHIPRVKPAVTADEIRPELIHARTRFAGLGFPVRYARTRFAGLGFPVRYTRRLSHRPMKQSKVGAVPQTPPGAEPLDLDT